MLSQVALKTTTAVHEHTNTKTAPQESPRQKFAPVEPRINFGAYKEATAGLWRTLERA
jgi:hypothetical protein